MKLNLFQLFFHKAPARFQIMMVFTVIILVIVAPPNGRAEAPPGWQTFSEADFGFEIDYPADWYPRLVVDNIFRAERYGEQVALRSIAFFGPNSQIVFVEVWHNPRRLSLTEWNQIYPDPLRADSSLRFATRPAAVNGKSALYEQALPPTQTPPQSPAHYRYQFQDGELIYLIRYSALAPNLETFEIMRRSFKTGPGNTFSGKGAIPRRASTLSAELPPPDYGVSTASCCGVSDPEYNPFPCNTAGDASCPYPPCGNCTWWARYRRFGGQVANLSACTGDANTWQGCASLYYPWLLSYTPDTSAVVLYPGQNHLSFVEQAYGSSYSASDLSWYDSCPARYFNASAGGGKQYILHPDVSVPNEPPNAPALDDPVNNSWHNSRDLTLKWLDGGDPDDSPQTDRDFFASIWNDDWTSHSGWRTQTSWNVTVPQDGPYSWRSKASDGLAESGWSPTWQLNVDTTAPQISVQASPPLQQWYNTEQTISWTIADPAPGIGPDYSKWAWDNTSPNAQLNGSSGSVNLSSAGQGQHALYLQAWDGLGNASAVTDWGWLGYDTVPPTFGFNPANPAPQQWYNTQRLISWTLTDPAPGIGGAKNSWRWDTAKPETGTSAQTNIPPLQGQHTLTLNAWDALGNTAPTQTQGWFGYDNLIPTQPEISLNCPAPNNNWQTECNAPVFSWSASDVNAPNAAGQIQYAFNWTTSPTVTVGAFNSQLTFSPTPLPYDQKTQMYLHVQAKDGAGNLSSPASFGFWFDGTLSSTVTVTETEPGSFGISLNDGALFTNVPTVTVSAWGPNVQAAQLTLDPAQTQAEWLLLPLSSTWVFSAEQSYFTPHRLYVWFKGEDEKRYGPFFDEISYDPIPPKGSIRKSSETGSQINLAISAWDDNSGLAGMRLNHTLALTDTPWQALAFSPVYTAGYEVVYVQFRDLAGNLSPIYGTDGSNSSLTEKVYLPLVWR